MGMGNRAFNGQKVFALERRSEVLAAVGVGTNALGLVIKALALNRSNVYIGERGITPETGYELVPGESVSADVLNAAVIFVLGARGEGVCYFGLQP